MIFKLNIQINDGCKQEIYYQAEDYKRLLFWLKSLVIDYEQKQETLNKKEKTHE